MKHEKDIEEANQVQCAKIMGHLRELQRRTRQQASGENLRRNNDPDKQLRKGEISYTLSYDETTRVLRQHSYSSEDAHGLTPVPFAKLRPVEQKHAEHFPQHVKAMCKDFVRSIWLEVSSSDSYEYRSGAAKIGLEEQYKAPGRLREEASAKDDLVVLDVNEVSADEPIFHQEALGPKSTGAKHFADEKGHANLHKIDLLLMAQEPGDERVSVVGVVGGGGGGEEADHGQ